jgi:hypothetical protein
MKVKYIIASLALLGASQVQANTFVNGGFEDGNLNGWTQGGGYTYTSGGGGVAPLNPAAYVGGTPTNTVMTSGVDPITGANTVYGGNYSVRVNDSNSGSVVSTISQTVTNYTDNNIFFAWNAVLEDSHDLQHSGYFSLTVVDDTAGTTLVSRAYSSAGSIGAGTAGVTWNTYNYGGTWYSSDWVVENVDLVALGAVGHTFTLSLLASDCFYGAHAGYVYLDGFGAVTPPTGPTNPNAVPVPAAAWLFGSGLLGFAGLRRKKIS